MDFIDRLVCGVVVLGALLLAGIGSAAVVLMWRLALGVGT